MTNSTRPVTISFAEARRLARLARPEPATYLTTEFGVVDFDADGTARIDDDRFAFAIAPDADRHTIAAARLIRDTYREYGACVLACDSCGDEAAEACPIDADANSADVARVGMLIQHALYDHITRRDVVAVIARPVLTAAAFTSWSRSFVEVAEGQA